MEKNIVDYFDKVLSNKSGHLSMNSLSGHLAGLSQKERKYIKKLGGLEKLILKYPQTFLICAEDVYVIPKEEVKEENGIEVKVAKEMPREGAAVPLQDRKSSVNLESARDDPCTVCSDSIEIYAIGECRHPICYRCSTKLRDLCKDKNCPVCRQTLDLVVFSSKLLPIDEHNIDSYIKDEKDGTAFENITIYKQKCALLRHVCPKCPNTIFEKFSDLEAHARDKHLLYYCSICVRQCKIFTDERKTYSQSELTKHIEKGDNTGSTIGGHPLCKFCEYRYLDNDELLRHLRLHHCSCRICDQVNEEQSYQFYVDKNSLLEHQREHHFPCEHPCCMDLDQIPVFKNEIDLRGHNLQLHSDQKSKLEKRAEQIINVPLLYEKKKTGPKKILTVKYDAIGGITVTGSVGRRVEQLYSFIERDDTPHQFHENVFFDLESCGLEHDDDLRNHFNTGDRVTAYALPIDHPYAKSKWKAQKVEKLEEEYGYGEEEEIPLTAIASSPPQEELNYDFPSLVTGTSVPQITSTLAGWSKLAQTAPARPMITMKPKQKAVANPGYEIGYIHKNLMEKFGFVQKEKNVDSFEENVYFNVDVYQAGMQMTVSDLRTTLSPGDKVCYTLQDGPAYPNVKTKLRARLVWKYSHNAEHVAALDPDGFKLVPGRPSTTAKVPTLETLPVISSDRIEALAKKYKKKLQYETKGLSLSQESSTSGGSQNDSSIAIMDEVIAANVKKKAEPFMFRVSKSATEHTNTKDGPRVVSGASSSKLVGSAPHLSLKGNSMISSFFFDTAPNSNHSNSGNIAQQSCLAQAVAITSNNTSDDDGLLMSSHTGSYSSDSDNESSEDEDSDDVDDMEISDPSHNKFMDTLAVFLNNQAIYKILKQQIAVEMEKQGIKSTTHLQFIEFRKEDSTAHILFHVPKVQNSGDGVSLATGYAKLTGFYPINSSWASELKAKQMATRVTKEFYQINGSGHYIIVARNKSEKSKVAIHYRPLYWQG